jgi:hypothetical protein
MLIVSAVQLTSIIWVFLALPIWLRKPQFLGVGKAWISLDSLVRMETYQWVARDFRRKFFRHPGSPEKPERAAVEAIRRGGVVHGASLTRFLIVSNHLSLAPVAHASSLLIRPTP